ncbi:MAG: hypothetical protein JSR75_19625 [Proteobacteria bacterium]|nr:hypothetical protein [Pseudomonadota bacterium]
MKAKLLREQGLLTTRAVDYELDHKVPLAIGGHPRNLKNLQLQAWEGHDGARRKDQIERALQRRVCDGRMPLTKAQAAIFFDWQAAYRELQQQ